LYGAGIGYLDTILENAGCRVTVMHHWRDPLFGGGNPEPDVERLQEAIAVMKKSRSKLVLATDGDADRFGIVDRDGTFLTPNQILGITLYLLVKHRRWEGRVVRSIVTSHFVDRVAGYFGLPVEEVPVGFKYIGESMQHKGFLLGGEESGGLTIQGHLPEKDGILACLLMTELVAREKRSLGEILKSLYALTGKVHSGRINVRLKTKFSGKILADKLESFKPKQLGGMAVNEIVRLDGTKYLLDDRAWLAFRLSGTEPVARLYAEAGSAAQLSRIMKAGQELLAGV
jgi:phosphomannomutase